MIGITSHRQTKTEAVTHVTDSWSWSTLHSARWKEATVRAAKTRNKEESESYNFILKTWFLQRGLKSSVHIFPSQLVSSVSAANICSGWPHSIKCATRRDVPQQQTPKKKQNGKLDKSLQILHLNILHSKLSEFYKGQRFFVDAQLDDPEYSVIEGGIK